MSSTGSRWLAALAAALPLAACGGRYEGGGELRAQRVVLQREVDGLRESVARLERGEAVFDQRSVAIAIDEALLRSLIRGELPFEAESGKNRLTLDEAEVRFHGAPTVRLRGRLTRDGVVDVQAAVEAIGAISGIAVDESSAALKARIALDHIGIEHVAGVESLVSGATLDELARRLRLALADKLPEIRIPVKIEQAIELPAVTRGPVRIAGARLPIAARVERVFAGEGRLWIGIEFEPGEMVKTKDAPEVGDVTAEDVETGLDDDDAEPQAEPAKKGAPEKSK